MFSITMSALRVLGSRLASASRVQTLAKSARAFDGKYVVDRASGKMPDGRPIGDGLPFQITNKPRMAVSLVIFSVVSFAVPFIAIEFQKYKASR
eukprot:CFRG7982T1